jgi:hypothetical protein
MASSDHEEVSMSVKERARLLNSQAPEKRPSLPSRPKSAPFVEESAPPLPERTSTSRPSLNQFGAKSEEPLQATKSGVVDLAGKGKVGFLEATDSIKGFIARPRWPNGEASDPAEATVMDFSFREHEDDMSTDAEQLTEVDSSTSSTRTGPKWKLPEFDHLAVGCAP